MLISLQGMATHECSKCLRQTHRDDGFVRDEMNTLTRFVITLNILPKDIFYVISEFLESRDMNNLLQSSSEIYRSCAYDMYYWKLNEEQSNQYNESDSFRSKLLSRMHNKGRQLYLNLSFCGNIVDVSALGGVHTLNLFRCGKIVDVSALGGVHTLNLFGCGKIVDVSALGGVHTLNLFGCGKIVDVSALGGVHTLNLSYCGKIVDASALGGVHTLNLSGCGNIVDVSALGGVHTLNLFRLR